MAVFDSKIFNPEVFGKYIDRIPNTKKSELAKSGALGSNQNARAALASQTGSLYARVPYFGKIDAGTSQNNTGAANINSTNTTTMDQGFVVASRMDAWTERSFSKNITAGVDFMDNVGKQLAEYKVEVKQVIMLKMLEGIFGMTTTGTSVRAKAAKEFVNGHTMDTTNISGVSPETLNSAIQKACGDNKSKIKLVIMTSTVATDLENQKLLSFMKYTDAEGIQKDLTMATWNGRTVLIDDDMPTTEVATTYKATTDTEVVAGKKYYTRSGSASAGYTYTLVENPQTSDIASYYEVDVEGYTTYTTYFLGEGSIIVDPIPDSVPYEMYRDPKTNGGEDTLYVRDRYICGFEGLSFEKPSSLTASASNDDLANGENWAVINDGTKSIPVKSIAIARLISRG